VDQERGERGGVGIFTSALMDWAVWNPSPGFDLEGRLREACGPHVKSANIRPKEAPVAVTPRVSSTFSIYETRGVLSNS